jgi:formylglycine-generating enzyme
MTLRPLAAVPLAVVGIALALSSTLDASAGDGEATAAATRAVVRAPKPSKRRSHLREEVPSERGAHKSPYCAWGDCAVLEGHLPDTHTGTVCPAGTANVDGRFCIDRWEASLVEVLPDGREAPWPPFDAVVEDRPVRAVSSPGVYPQAYISGAQAAQACAAAGKRLCAPVEWRKACVGPRDRTFGYGNERVAGRCNDEAQGKSPMLRLYPQVAVSWNLVGMTEMNDARLNQLDNTLAPTGAHDQCTNEYGVFDMVGNLHEWTNDPHGTFQGGYYLDTHLNGDGCSYRTVAHAMSYHDYSTGFRCCSDPQGTE